MTAKRYCFVFMGNLYLCPYIKKYLDIMNVPFDIIFWNRDGIEEDVGAERTYSFDYRLRANASMLEKILGYIAFRKYAEKILKENDYNGVILLQTFASILLGNILKKKYWKRYILDIRDYTWERNKIFYSLEKKIIEGSANTIISSEGYKDFLPQFNYIITHNNRTLDRDRVRIIRNKNNNSEKIVISFIGFVNYQDQHKKLIMLFKNDNRFELHFIGKEAENLLSFCEENGITNVKIIGKFPPEEILDYYYDTNIVNNLYGNNIPALDYALSNKLYFAAELRMPILVCPGTYMEKVSCEFGFGYTFDMDRPDAVDSLYTYYTNINWEKFNKNCDMFLGKVNEDNLRFNKAIENFIS